jgi:hypothetical protein
VIGMSYLLRRAVRMRLIGPDEAWEIYRAMPTAGRHLGTGRSRRV